MHVHGSVRLNSELSLAQQIYEVFEQACFNGTKQRTTGLQFVGRRGGDLAKYSNSAVSSNNICWLEFVVEARKQP